MSKRPWFPFYTSDFERKTKHLSAEGVGAYIRLMMHYWDNSGNLTDDPAQLCRIMGIERRRYKKMMLQIGTFLLPHNRSLGDAILLPRLQEELERTIAISKVKAEAGKKGGEAYAQAHREHMPTHSHSHTHIDIKDKSREGKQVRKKRATSLPENWVLPDDYRAYCVSKRDDLNPDVVAENFRDYYLSHGKLMVDWKRTWQRWVRNEHGTTGQKRSGTSNRIVSTPADRNQAAGDSYFGKGNW